MNSIQLKLVHTLFHSTNSVFIPYLPLLLMQRGFSTIETSTLLMLGPFIAMFAQPVAGVISDRMGAVRPLLLSLWLVMGICATTMFLTTDPYITTASLLIMYIFFMPTVSLLDALTVKMAPVLGTTYSSIRLWGSVGFCLMLVGMGMFFDQIGGVSALLWIFLSIWSGVMMMFLIMREPEALTSGVGEVEEAGKPRTLNWQSVRQVFSNPTLLVFFGMLMLIAIPHRMNDGLLSIHLQAEGGTGNHISWAWAVAGASEIVGFFFMGNIVKRFSMQRMLLIVSILYTIRWGLCVVFTDPWAIVAIQAMHAITFVAVWVTSIEFVARILPREMNATGQALLNMLFIGVAGIAGGSIGGALHESYGGAGMYSFGIVCAALAAIGFMIWSSQSKKRKQVYKKVSSKQVSSM